MLIANDYLLRKKLYTIKLVPIYSDVEQYVYLVTHWMQNEDKESWNKCFKYGRP